MAVVNSGRGEGIIHACKSCGVKNRVPYARLGDETKCGKCKASIDVGASPIELESAAAFDALVNETELLVVVDFWASWCGPCIAGLPQIEKAAADSSNRYLIAKVNVDMVSDVAARFAIRAVPTMIRFAGGSEAGRQTGAHPAPSIMRFALG